MPPKIRQLVKALKKAGFIDRSGKGSHKVFKHPLGQIVVLSGNPGADAKRYQIAGVQKSIEESKS